MKDLTNQQKAVELLQQLGLKEYEARSFVALVRLPRATAKEISEISDVPRTRVYDAIRVLETKGLVEIQHSNPQVFRAVSIPEAAETFRKEYEERTKQLKETLQGLESADVDENGPITHEVWSLSGTTAIVNRMDQLIGRAEDELILVVGHESIVTDTLIDHLETAQQRDVTVIVGTVDVDSRDRLRTALPNASIFVSELEWLESSPVPADDTEIGRLLLVDYSTILISTFHDSTTDGQHHEQAVFGKGFDNGFVAIVRRLMATGLLPTEDPGRSSGDTDR